MIDPVFAIDAFAPAFNLSAPAVPKAAVSFSQMLRQGVEAANNKVIEADRLVTAFALDDTIPAHQVTFALEEARLSLELMVQVRNRLVEGYQQITNMQV